jgi:hypothetical protein
MDAHGVVQEQEQAKQGPGCQLPNPPAKCPITQKNKGKPELRVLDPFGDSAIVIQIEKVIWKVPPKVKEVKANHGHVNQNQGDKKQPDSFFNQHRSSLPRWD